VLVAAAVCPNPPLLVPEIGVGLGAEVEDLRQQCARVVDDVCALDVDRLFVVGAAVGAPARSFAPWAPGSGVADVVVDVPEPLPLPLLVGGYLTRGRQRSFVVVDPQTEPADCVDLGRDLAAAAPRTALLVMGDGAARHDAKAPGYVDPRAAGWDEAVQRMFAAGDLGGLAALDATVADELMCSGRAPWQVLAGAAGNALVRTDSAALKTLFGVGYFVARWSLVAGDGAPTANS
jgi:hypothetical protein